MKAGSAGEGAAWQVQRAGAEGGVIGQQQAACFRLG